ncbi:MAG: TonB-dependent siderophore receptor [Alphaproteobacteria bacterium PA2]|nr:MAG: TonB-dependent siderophore receptor [Alphaproteobacteria bacterium PA2]
MKSYLFASSMLVGSALLASASPAFAQIADKSAGRTDSWVSEVVVAGRRDTFAAPTATTATRTATPTEEIPQSIQSLTRTFIEEQDLQTVSAALVNISGVAPAPISEIVLQAPKVRGFEASYYIDGLPAYGLPSGTVDPGSLINVERVEVAKGPASTLYGGGTGAPLAGLINLVSRDPGQTRSFELGLRAGSFNTRSLDGDFNLPLSDNGAGFRLTGFYEAADSAIRSVDSRRYAIYPTLGLNLGVDTHLTLRGQVTRIEQQEYAGLPYALINQASVDRFAFAGAEDAPPTTIDNKLLTATLTHRFTDRWEGTLTARRYNSHFEEFSTFPFTGAPIAGTVYAFASASLPTKVSQTFLTASLLRKAGEGPVAHEILLGVDYDKADYSAGLGFGFVGVVDYANRTTNPTFGAAPVLSDRQVDSMNSAAVYVQDQVGIGENLDVTVSLRWTSLDITSSYVSGGVPFVNTDKSYSRVTPRIGATYRITPGISAFAGYGEGFKGLVASFGLTDPKPETSQSYEAGLKFTAPIRGLTGTASIYQVARQNVSTPDPANPFASLQTGEQKAKGFELDLVYEPNPALSVLATFAHTEAEVSKDNLLPVGDRLTRTPENAGRIALRYRFQSQVLKGLEIGGGLTAVSDRELTLPNSLHVGGSTLVDAQASYAFGPRTSLSLSVVNLTDSDAYEPYQYLARAVVAPTQPRSAFITLRAKF